MNLALNNPQRLICHKTQPNNQHLISLTFLSILADFNSAVVNMLAILPLISGVLHRIVADLKSSVVNMPWILNLSPTSISPFFQAFGDRPNGIKEITNTVTFIFYRSSSALVRSKYISAFPLSLYGPLEQLSSLDDELFSFR